MISHLELDRALSVILRKAMEVSGTTAGSIALYHPDSRTLRIQAHKGLPAGFIANREWFVRPGGVMDRVLKRGNLSVITDVPNRSFFFDPANGEERLKALVCVPLVHQKEAMGVLFVDDGTPRMLSGDELEALEILASFAAIAISHARTHREISHQAVTDGLTGLLNRRSFEEVLQREYQRAERHGREFALALVDVDDFKLYNDRYGHPAGDALLAALGTAIRQSLRTSDYAARYGGDEMVIILPETGLEKAYQLFRRRITAALEQELRSETGDHRTAGVTIGIASYPQDGATAREVVQAADRALLDAKKDKHRRVIGCARPVAACVTP